MHGKRSHTLCPQSRFSRSKQVLKMQNRWKWQQLRFCIRRWCGCLDWHRYDIFLGCAAFLVPFPTHSTMRRREDLICTKNNSFGWNARWLPRDTLRAKYCGCTWKWNIFYSVSVCHFPHPVQDRKLIRVQVRLIMTLLRKRCRPYKIRTTMEWAS